jgi:hypothetical protein
MLEMPNRPRSIKTDAEMKAWLETQYDVNENGCWVWKGAKNQMGHGMLTWNTKCTQVHRLYWLLSGRSIPDGFDICHGHNCSKSCFNVDHIRADTKSANNLDKHRDGTMKCKLTPAQITEIRNEKFKTQTEMAQEYGVCCTTIWSIIHRRKWVWV